MGLLQWLCCLILLFVAPQGSGLGLTSSGVSLNNPAQPRLPKPAILFSPDMHTWWQYFHRQNFSEAEQLLDRLHVTTNATHIAWQHYLQGLLAFEQGEFTRAWELACTHIRVTDTKKNERVTAPQQQETVDTALQSGLRSLLLSVLVEGFRNGKSEFLYSLAVSPSMRTDANCWRLAELKPVFQVLRQPDQKLRNKPDLVAIFTSSVTALGESLAQFETASGSPFIASLVLQSNWYLYNFLNDHQAAANKLNLALTYLTRLEQRYPGQRFIWHAWRVDIQGQLSVSLIRLEQFHLARRYLSHNIALTRNENLANKAVVEQFNLAYVYRQLGQADLARQYYLYSEQQSEQQQKQLRKQPDKSSNNRTDNNSAAVYTRIAALADMAALSRINLASIDRQKSAAQQALEMHLRYEHYPFQPQYRYFELLVQLELARDEVALSKLNSAQKRVDALLQDTRLLQPQKIEALLLLMELQVARFKAFRFDLTLRQIPQLVADITHTEAQLEKALSEFKGVTKIRPGLLSRYQIYFLQWQSSRVQLQTAWLESGAATRAANDYSEPLAALLNVQPTQREHNKVNAIVSRIVMEAQSPQAWIQSTQHYYNSYVAWLWAQAKHSRITKEQAANQIFRLLDENQRSAFAGLQHYWRRYAEVLEGQVASNDLQRLLSLEAQMIAQAHNKKTSITNTLSAKDGAASAVFNQNSGADPAKPEPRLQYLNTKARIMSSGAQRPETTFASNTTAKAFESQATSVLPALSAHQVYVRFHVTDALVLALLLLPGGQLIVDELPADAVNRWAASLQHAKVARAVNGRVQSLFFQSPVSDWFKSRLAHFSRRTELVWSPGGNLHWVPLAAINIAEKAGAYEPLLTKVAVIRTHSAFDYFASDKAWAKRYGNSKQKLNVSLFALTAFSDGGRVSEPVVSNLPASNRLRTWFRSLPDLPATKHEINLIYAGLADQPVKATVWLDQQATTAVLLSEARRQDDILHIATHGFYHSEAPELTGIITADHANPNQQSGMLTLAQLLAQPFRNQLVVLSGCETMLGELFNGTGMNGMTHGFLARGAGSTLGTIWKVLDKPTSVLQSGLYRELPAHYGNVPAALRASQLTMFNKARYRDPRYWAGFVYTAVHQSTNRFPVFNP